MHKKTMQDCSEKLKKDAVAYKKKATAAKSKKIAKEKRQEKKEALSAANFLKSKAKSAHER